MTINEQDDLSDAGREQEIDREAALDKRLMEREGVRFFACLAAKYSVRLSALCFYVVVNTRTKRRKDKSAQWRKKAEDVAKEIGSSTHHVYWLLEKAKAAGLLDYTRTPRQSVMWVTDATLYDEYDAGTQDKLETRIGRFEPKLAKVLGLNGSLLYSFTKYHTDRDDGCRRDHRGFKMKYSWMAEETVRKELARLIELEVLKTVDDPDCEHPRYVVGVPLSYADVEAGVRLLTAAEMKKRLQNYKPKKPEKMPTRLPENLPTPAEDFPTRPENLPTPAEKMPTPNKPHAIALCNKAPRNSPKQCPLPTPAEANPPSASSPSAVVSDKEHGCFASVFEEDERHMEFGQEEPVEKARLVTERKQKDISGGYEQWQQEQVRKWKQEQA
jgi:hypothetical protein